MVEVQVINKILKSKDIKSWIEYGLTVSDFFQYPDELKFIFDHFSEYKEVPDSLTFVDKFPEFTICEVSDSDESLMKRVKEEVLARQMMPAMKDMASKINDHLSYDAFDDMVNFMQSTRPYSTTTGTDYISLFKESLISPPTSYISTSFDEIDRFLGGGIDTDDGFVSILGGTGIGKSWILCKIAADLYKKGKRVLFLSMELSQKVIADRITSLLTHMPYEDIRDRLFRNRDSMAYDVTSDGSLIISDTIMIDTYTMERIYQLVLINKPDVVIIDDISYIQSDKETLYEQLKDTGLSLRNLSISNKMPIITSLQLNRDGGKKGSDATVYDVSGSIAIPQISAITIMISSSDDDKVTLKILKHRQGSGTGKSATYTIDKYMAVYRYTPTADEFLDDDEPTPMRGRPCIV